ncbi:MAG: 30S ribosomal protein S6 [Thermodesulfobacteriota bacterium]|nr:30S ribosomal protein S6 [Thermodesulfobacteriota bacterium]
MRRYESVFITSPSLSKEDRQPLLDKLTKIISDGEGLLVKFDEWGLKSLAYVVKKQTRGYYVLTDFCGDGALVKELERNMSLDERFLKYMTVCTAEEVDVAAVEAEMAAVREASRPEAAPEEKPPGGEEAQSPQIEPAADTVAAATETTESGDKEAPANGEV